VIALAIGMVAGMALLAGLGLALRPLAGDTLIMNAPALDRIDAALPQIQCGQCGYPGCRPYAAAILAGRADIDRCPPGGAATRRQLAEMLGRPRPSRAGHDDDAVPVRALIDEALCIGCLKCVQACPVDAILGASGRMHAVIPGNCTGCGLCARNCPYGNIFMVHPQPELGPLDWLRRLFGFPERAAEGAEGESDGGREVAVKCDLCAHLSGGPACVRSCPTGAAIRLTPDQYQQTLEDLVVRQGEL